LHDGFANLIDSLLGSSIKLLTEEVSCSEAYPVHQKIAFLFIKRALVEAASLLFWLVRIEDTNPFCLPNPSRFQSTHQTLGGEDGSR